MDSRKGTRQGWRTGTDVLRVGAGLRRPQRRSRGGVSQRGLVLGVEPGLRDTGSSRSTSSQKFGRSTGAPSPWNSSELATTPTPSGCDERPISIEQWDECFQEDSVLVDPICIGFDVSPERRTSIAAAGKNQDGLWHVEIFEKRPGTQWVAGRLEELIYDHSPEKIVCDAMGPGKSLVQLLELAEIRGRDVRLGPARRSLREVRRRGDRAVGEPPRESGSTQRLTGREDPTHSVTGGRGLGRVPASTSPLWWRRRLLCTRRWAATTTEKGR